MAKSNYTEKAVRIEELHKLGFNTPRMMIVPEKNWVRAVMDFVKHGTAFRKSDLCNIRTYERATDENREGFNRPHITQVTVKEAIERLQELLPKYVCMIDLETPGDGMFAGEIQIFPDYSWRMTYCVGPGAVVRNANISVEGNYRDDPGYHIKDFRRRVLPIQISEIIAKSFNYKIKPVILEWSYQMNRCGKLYHYDIWWEYRDRGIG